MVRAILLDESNNGNILAKIQKRQKLKCTGDKMRPNDKLLKVAEKKHQQQQTLFR